VPRCSSSGAARALADGPLSAAVAHLNEVLSAMAHEEKLVRLDRVRADTTVVEANVAYPTDSGLLAKGVAKMGVLVAT